MNKQHIKANHYIFFIIFIHNRKADIFNGLMALPNVIALLALSGVVASETKAYEQKLK